MSLFTLNRVSQSFGTFDIFRNVSAALPVGARAGLVGPNGAGKTSLLHIIAGLAKPVEGQVSFASGVRIGYLHQEAMHAFTDRNGSLLDALFQVFEGVQAMETRLRELEHAMADDPAAIDSYGDLLEQYEAAGGYDFPHRIELTLSGLGFQPEDYDTPLVHLSGGQKTRALLARLLLESPDLLILDEPTNHLDVDAIHWLETLLRQWKGTLLIVSHDRYFLDVVADTIWELTPEGIESYRGNYSAYLKQREERQQLAMKRYESEIARFQQEIDYIKRNIARAATTDIAVGRLRRLSRELVAIETRGLTAFTQSKSWIEMGVGSVRPMTVMEAEAAVKAIPKPEVRLPRLNLALRPAPVPGGSSSAVLRTLDLRIGYSTRSLFSADNVVLMAGERAALIGGNGTGKTTFLRTLRGEIAPLAGQAQWGSKVRLGYFAQAHGTLTGDHTVLDELMRHKALSPGEARGLLARYLFREDAVFKPVSALSGGERAKLALAVLALEGAGVLILDEPTNHLDIPAQEALQEVLETFDGTILMVTHDRYLVDRLATQIWSIDDGQMRVFSGTYREFLATERDSERKPLRALA
ncbi:MAG: ABC-F family ATP-binding cassette domain-containing protein [Anaerolineae bacterium]